MLRAKSKELRYRFLCLAFVIYCLWSVEDAFGDWVRLKEPEKGNEVEILEEQEDCFIIKISKDEIEMITRKQPTKIKLWKEKRILWEDTGDYLTLYLPKEKIILPEGYTGEDYDSAKALGKELTYTGAEGRPADMTFWKGTGRVLGRILKKGEPLAGAKVKIVSIPSQLNVLTRILTPTAEDSQPQELVFETTSDEKGYFEFRDIPLGEYDLYWSPPEGGGWFRRLSEKADIIVKPGETTRHPDIKIK